MRCPVMMRSVATPLLVLSLCCAFSRMAYAGDPAKGKAIYDGRCAFCHGSSGKGDGPAGTALKPRPTDFANADFWKSTTLEAVEGAIEHGKPGTAMMAFQASLSKEQVDDVVTYPKAFKPLQ